MRILIGISAAIFAAACGGEPIYVVMGGDGGAQMQPGGDAGGGTHNFASAQDILSYLDGKTLTMTGMDIPPNPNGFDEDTNFGQASQCYQKVTMHYLAGRLQINSLLATLRNAPNTRDHGECDHAAAQNELSFESTAVLVENVKDNGGCFDMTVTYPGFGQEGRGKIEADGSMVVLELFFKDQATGHRCAAGNVGSPSVTLNGAMFTGNAQQNYRVSG